MFRILCIAVFSLFFTAASASPDVSTETLFSIQMHSWAQDRSRNFSYILILPRNEYYSYYLGSDVPTFHVVHDSVMQSGFRSEELMTIHVHAEQAVSANTARLIIVDPENLRVIWQGELSVMPNGKVSANVQLDNKKYYDVKLTQDVKNRNVSFEITPLNKD